jgi:hypothetical protein
MLVHRVCDEKGPHLYAFSHGLLIAKSFGDHFRARVISQVRRLDGASTLGNYAGPATRRLYS